MANSNSGQFDYMGHSKIIVPYFTKLNQGAEGIAVGEAMAVVFLRSFTSSKKLLYNLVTYYI